MQFILASFLTLFSITALAHTRGLVVVIDLAEEASKHKGMYRTETKVAVQRIKRITRGHYDRLTILHRQQATRENFLQALESHLLDESVDVVDTIIYVHGKNELYQNGAALCFVGDAPCTAAKDLAESISRFKNSQTKLRALYSDACWGKSHLSAWMAAGFKVANGSRGVDSNHSLDLRRFLDRWVRGESFEASTHFANKALLTRLTDKVIKDANSFKEVSGDGLISIETSPASIAE